MFIHLSTDNWTTQIFHVTDNANPSCTIVSVYYFALKITIELKIHLIVVFYGGISLPPWCASFYFPIKYVEMQDKYVDM